MAWCLANPALIKPDVWSTSLYDKLPIRVPVNKRGRLPFRVWQLFDAMSDRLRDNDIVGVLAVAGVTAHYSGNACQPLHGSVMSNGDRSRMIKRWLPRKKQWDDVAFGEGVHSAYDRRHDFLAPK